MANSISISPAPYVKALNTVSSTSYAPQYVKCNTNGLPYSFNSPNATFNPSQPQSNQRDVYKFEIPGFEIIVRPKFNPVMNSSNLDTQYQLRGDKPMNSYYISNFDETSTGGSRANSANIMNMQDIYHNNQSFATDNSQSQFQQRQNSPGFNNLYYG
jgi:hypothetical protein